MAKEKSVKEKLVMVQGYDRNDKAFTAFVLCDDQQSIQIQNAKANTSEPFDLTELHVIHSMAGHNIDEKTQHDIQEYYQQLVGEV